METPEAIIHSFIIKIWIEEIFPEEERLVWEGHMVHVPDNEFKYFRNLEDIPRYISQYLDEEIDKAARKRAEKDGGSNSSSGEIR